jgi:recombination protein RecA
VDSVASLLPREELEHDLGDGKDDRMASRARMMSRGLRRATTVNLDTAFIWTNHTIEKIGAWGGGRTTPGGRSLGFYATMRVEMLKGKKVKEERTVPREGKMVKKEQIVGHWVNIRCEKNKSATPYREQMFYFDSERKRVDPAVEILHLGMEDGLIEEVKVGRSNGYTYTMNDGTEYEGTLRDWRGWIDQDENLREELTDLIHEETAVMASGD